MVTMPKARAAGTPDAASRESGSGPVRLCAVAAKGLLQHVELGTEEVDLGPDVVFQGNAGDDGEMAERGPGGHLAHDEGLHSVGQERCRDRHRHRPATGRRGRGEADAVKARLLMPDLDRGGLVPVRCDKLRPPAPGRDPGAFKRQALRTGPGHSAALGRRLSVRSRTTTWFIRGPSKMRSSQAAST